MLSRICAASCGTAFSLRQGVCAVTRYKIELAIRRHYDRTLPMTADTNVTASSEDKAGRTALEESSKEGAFVRKESTFRNWISEENEKFKPEGSFVGSIVFTT